MAQAMNVAAALVWPAPPLPLWWNSLRDGILVMDTGRDYHANAEEAQQKACLPELRA